MTLPASEFPPSSEALDYPNGLIAIGGELSSQRLLDAYQRGIFPWYEEPQAVQWWTPDPRSILRPESLHISRSLAKTLRQNQFRVSVDTCFASVMRQCAQARQYGPGTWIGEDMMAAYGRLHDQGHAHSVEVFDRSDRLVGGLYGVSLGLAFFGESMFSAQSNTSKIAMVALVSLLKPAGFRFIDCQIESEHLNSLGANNISRLDFEGLLAHTVDKPVDSALWSMSLHCGELS